MSNVNKSNLFYISLAFVAIFISISSGHSAGNGVPHLLSFQGRLTDSLGRAINYTTQVTFRIYPAASDCFLYEEVQSVTPNAYGIFSTLLGSAGNSTGPVNLFYQVFNNDPRSAVVDSCGQIYQPTQSEWRRLQILINGEVLPGMQTIGSSAYAIHSQYLQGYAPSDFIKASSTLTESKLESLLNGSDASVHHHHDGRYLRSDSIIPVSGNIISSGNIIMNGPSSQMLISTAGTSPTADLDIQKQSPTLRLGAASGGGQSSKIQFYSGTTTQRASIQGFENVDQLSFYTGTTEALRITASQDASFMGSISTLGVLSLGKYDGTTEPSLLTTLAALGPVGAGTLWMSTASGILKYWDGSQVISLGGGPVVSSVGAGTGISITGTSGSPVVNVVYGAAAGTAIQGNASFGGDVSGTYGAVVVEKIKGVSLDFSSAPADGQYLKFQSSNSSWVPSSLPPVSAITTLNAMTGSSQSFAIGTSGSSPAFSSGSNVHTLNIPQASSGAGVTAGLLSNSEFQNFTKRDGTTAFSADQSMGGFKITNVADPVSSQDSATKNYVDNKLATRTLSTAAPGVGQVLGWSGTQWQPASLPADVVSSVFSRTGAITAQSNDYTWAQIDKSTSSLADIATRSASDLSSGTLPDARLSANVSFVNASNTWSTGAQNFSSATSLQVPVAAGAAPTTNGMIAYDSTANQWKVGVNGAANYLTQAAGALTLNNLVKGDGNGKILDSGFSVIGAGTGGINASNAGTATTLARSDHVHKVLYTVQWFFPGLVVTGVQTARVQIPLGMTSCVITGSQISVNTNASGASTYNIQRCASASCGSPTNIYTTAPTLNASTESVTGGAPNTTTISAGDIFRVNLVSVGSGLADVTVAMTYKCEVTN